MNPGYSSDDIGRIIAGIEADEELKELDKHGFCFCPPNASSPKETLCGCIHLSTKHKRGS